MSTAGMPALKAPFPYFGGKSRIAARVWEAFGAVSNYVEPFFGSGAVLLARPHAPGVETVNDADGFLSNFWRALQADPEAVAHYADWPVNENDLHARHAWLVPQRGALTARLEGDPDFYDAKVAGWWVWGLACWIGGGWCSGAGPWHVVDGALVRTDQPGGQGVRRQRVHLGTAGQGVQRQLVHLGPGRGVQRALVHLGTAGRGGQRAGLGEGGLLAWFAALATRLRHVRVCCGDWTRVCGPSVTVCHGLTGVFLDPPYGGAVGREMGVYAVDDGDVAGAVRAWCLAQGADPQLRIALCGYGDEHDALLAQGWTRQAWAAQGGMGNRAQGRGRANKAREVVWFSPHCLQEEALRLFT